MHIIGFLLLPIVLALCVLHFLMLFFTRLFGWRRAEIKVWRHLLALDSYANTLIGGDHRETISSRLGRNEADGCKLCGLLCRVLDLFDKDHCQKANETFRREYKE